MQTCTFFATYTGWLSRELERSDSDLSGSEKPGQMSKQQWERYQAERTHRHRDSTASNASATTPSEEARVMISKFEVNFSRHLQILLDALNHYAATETVVLLGLCARLSTANQGTTYSGLRADEDGASHG